jgi:hypothetical protein
MYLATRSTPVGMGVFRSDIKYKHCPNCIVQKARESFFMLYRRGYPFEDNPWPGRWAVHFYKELFRFYVLLPFIVVCTVWWLKARARDKEQSRSEPQVAADFVVVDDDDADTKKRTTTSDEGKSPTESIGGDTNCNEQDTRRVPSTSKDTGAVLDNSRVSAQSGKDFVIINEKPPSFNDRAANQISEAVRKIRTFNPSTLKRKQIIVTASTHGLVSYVNTWALFLFFRLSRQAAQMESDPIAILNVHPLAGLYEMQDALHDLEREASHLPKLITYSRSQEAFSFRPMSHIILATAISPIALLLYSSIVMAVTRFRRSQQVSSCEASSEALVSYATLIANIALAFVTTVVIFLLLKPVEIQNVGIFSSPSIPAPLFG